MIFDRVFRYFDSDDFDDGPPSRNKLPTNRPMDDDLDYQPAPGSPSYQAPNKANAANNDDDDDDDDDEDDPLEQFMKANNSQAKKDLESMGKKKDKKQEK